MRITIVQGAFFPVPPLLGGAVEKIWFALGREFARRGHEVVHISRRFPGLPDEEVLDGVRHIRVSGFASPASLFVLKILDLAYSLKVLGKLPAADILVTHTFWLPFLIRHQRFGHLYVHVARYPKGQMGFYRHAARLHTISTAVVDAIIHQSPACKEIVKKIPYPLLNDVTASKEELTTTPRRNEFLFVGRIHPEKGLLLLLEAYEKYCATQDQPWDLVIVGPWEESLGGGGEAFLQKLRQSCSPKILPRITWTGFVSDVRELRKKLLQAGLFIYPSLAEKGESFGLAPLEAMGCGCPVLTSSLQCFSEYIVDSETGFLFNHQTHDPAETLASKLIQLTSDPAARARVAECGWRRAAEFSLDRIAEKHLEDFASILAARP